MVRIGTVPRFEGVWSKIIRITRGQRCPILYILFSPGIVPALPN